jgi:hypothetical protein
MGTGVKGFVSLKEAAAQTPPFSKLQLHATLLVVEACCKSTSRPTVSFVQFNIKVKDVSQPFPVKKQWPLSSVT